SRSQKLTAYPADLIATPLDVRRADIDALLDPAALSSPTPSASTSPAGGAGPGGGPVASAAPAGAVPGGVAGELPDIFRTVDLTPLAILASLLTAIAIAPGPALTPRP